MADLDLRVDYKDDILDSSANTKRKYNIIENEDGTKSLEDVSVYTQNGDSFGAADINKTNQAVLDLNSSLSQIGECKLIKEDTNSTSYNWNIEDISKYSLLTFSFDVNFVTIPYLAFKTLGGCKVKLPNVENNVNLVATFIYVSDTNITVTTTNGSTVKLFGTK